jgi:hypothetical protein
MTVQDDESNVFTNCVQNIPKNTELPNIGT